MLARLQQTLVMTLVICAAAWAWYWTQHGQPFWAVAGAISILLVHAPVLALEFVMLHYVNRGDSAPRATRGQLVRAWWHEVLSGVAVFGWRQPFRQWAEPDHLPPETNGRRAVVFVHGFVCNRALWNTWMRRLRARGVPFVAVNLEPLFGSIDRYAEIIEAAVVHATQATGQAPLVVAHSMGGLAVRAWLRKFDADTRAAGIVTIGTPHRGTWLGRFAYAANARQMQLAGPWLEALAGLELPARRERFTCFYSHCDNIVFPASTATLPGANNRHLPGVAHVQMVDRPEVFDEVLRRLTTQSTRAHPATVELTDKRG
jgi:pimeloyl-ACP methyl ester carboxylesterase